MSRELQRISKAVVEKMPFVEAVELCMPDEQAISERKARDSVDIQSPLQTPVSAMMEESLSQLSETPPSSIATVDEKTKSRKGSFRSDTASNEVEYSPFWAKEPEDFLPELFSENVVAKIWGIASEALWQNSPPEMAPEYTQPPGGTTYVNTGIDFWTSGFFPGSLYLLLERAELYPNAFPQGKLHKAKLLYASRWWSENLHVQAKRTDTHDLGFMIQPSFQKDFELTGNDRSLQTLVTAAESLASRYDERVGAIRSWDVCRTKRYRFEDPSKDYLVIIDNMLNLDMLFYVASKTGDARLSNIAIQHALTTMKHHIREDWSTVHVVNFDQYNGKVKDKFTNQGYWDDSTWSRGQAWGVLGFAQVYGWTKRKEFLDTSKKLARYFLSRLPADCVPYWDFDAPRPTYRDTSAAMIFISGLLEIYKHCSSPLEGAEWLYAAKRILNSVLKMSLSPRAKFLKDGKVDMGGFDAILKNATINNYEYAPRRWADHGLVYADYFLLQVGNKLLSLGLLE